MKLLFLLIIAIIFPAEIKADFHGKVNAGYETYREVIYYENPYYEISIIQGINNDEVTFGLLFYNHKPASDPHRVAIFIKGKEYKLKTNSRKDIFAPAIALKDDVEIRIYDSFGRKRGNSFYLQAMDATNFRSTFDDLSIGENSGIELSKLSRNFGVLKLEVLLLIIFASIIIICGLIILILFITKKGMFNEKKKIENIFNFREFAKTLYEQAEYQEPFFNREEEEEEFIEVTPIYERQRLYEGEEEQEVDVTKLLQEKGFNVDYHSLSEAEKNEIMLELMMMRDLKEITLEQYQQEVIKLWSK